MSTLPQASQPMPALPLRNNDVHWYAVMSRPKHEKKVAEAMRQVGLPVFLPLVTEMHRWSDRRKAVEMPLFPGYLFVRITPTAESKVSVLRLAGVLQLVGGSGYGTPIADSEIESIRVILKSDLVVSNANYVKVGQRVRVRGGSLDGVEGVLAERGRRLVVSVNAIHRSLSIILEGFTVEPVTAS
jgi:transcription antitermination factor NusG